MTLSRDGFLSTDINALVDEAMKAFCPNQVALVERLNRYAIAVLAVPRDIQQRDADLFAVALLARTVQDFAGAVLLAARGLRAQSRAMVRSTFETALYCRAAALDLVLSQGARIKPKKGESPTTRFVDAFEGGHQRFRGQVAAEIRDMPEVSAETEERLGALLDEIGTPGQHQDIDLRGLAEDLDLSNLYTIVYRSLSQDAHPSATSLEHHVAVNAERKITGIHIGPDYLQFCDTLVLAACSLLVALEGFVDHFGTEQERRELGHLVHAYGELANSSPDCTTEPSA
ncbi:DUF5677 domain-containing protein [Burkholderia cenocepacia]|uniref:DUF5677 domain-containing protein n=1 Tax=Burkholderia cenocepacia TaxID=95486 RepID=UPI001BA352DA|nr:DUF5677 domain-containing protein [Burkholderia cenocepacia]MBR8137207.1 hypothetical protein [Burkholderia cenocepacia]